MANKEFQTQPMITCETAEGYQGSVAWRAPSNIALVKYWGKKEGQQLPANPSLSFSLHNSYTETRVDYRSRRSGEGQLEVFLNGRRANELGEKARKSWRLACAQYPALAECDVRIDTVNSFPHSAGIASSASGMSALALCALSLARQLTGGEEEPNFDQQASSLARLGSGSAARSVFGGYALWGAYRNLRGSSDHYAIPIGTDVIHPLFTTVQDAILLIDPGPKSVSSTAGHALLKGHPFAEGRYQAAHQHLDRMLVALRSGDWEAFGEIVEREALMLHALMMSSNPPYVLMHPNTLHALQKIQHVRKQTGLPVYFTLDAGANLHLLHPVHELDQVSDFVEQELRSLCQREEYICDEVGTGPTRIM
jgi:diphosphomevalonate decarboxylase